MKVTIIGGSGFVGTNLCRVLSSKNINFEIIDLKISKQFPKHCKVADIRDLEALEKSVSGDIIVHLAAAHLDNLPKSEYESVNVTGTNNLAKVCTSKKIKKIIFTSSVAVYGFATGTDEGGAINPFNEYGKTKYKAEKILENWRAENISSLIIIRPTVIFGVGNRGNVYNLFNQIYLNRFFMVGDGKNKKSLAFIDNVTNFIVKCIDSSTDFEIVNYVDGPDLDMNELVSSINAKLNGKKTIGLRFPFWLGLFVGNIADLLSFITKKRFKISSVRIRKFTQSTQFYSSNNLFLGFSEKIELIDGINQTLEAEFLTDQKPTEIFYTE